MVAAAAKRSRRLAVSTCRGGRAIGVALRQASSPARETSAGIAGSSKAGTFGQACRASPTHSIQKSGIKGLNWWNPRQVVYGLLLLLPLREDLFAKLYPLRTLNMAIRTSTALETILTLIGTGINIARSVLADLIKP
jgi:hypothetical protein